MTLTPFDDPDEIPYYGGASPATTEMTGDVYQLALDLTNDYLVTNVFPNDPDAAIVPHFGNDGFRTLAALVVQLCRFYSLYQATIDPYLSGPEKTAVQAVCALAGAFAVANNAGPT